MNEEQKRFKVLKKEEYEKEISRENSKATLSTFALGVTGLCTIVMASVALPSRSIDDVLCYFFTSATGILSAFNLKSLIEHILNKTMLKNKLEDINNELEMAENINDQQELTLNIALK